MTKGAFSDVWRKRHAPEPRGSAAFAGIILSCVANGRLDGCAGSLQITDRSMMTQDFERSPKALKITVIY